VFYVFLQMGSQVSSIPSKTSTEKRLLVKVIKATSLGAKKGNCLYSCTIYMGKYKCLLSILKCFEKY